MRRPPVAVIEFTVCRRPSADSSARRRGARVIYYFYSADFPLLLLGLYAKNEKADLSGREKKALVDAVKEITESWRRR